MTIAPVCDSCGSELTRLGALVFTPPDDTSRVKKYHLCFACFYDHRLIVDADGDWTLEHSFGCRLSGEMHKCKVHLAVAREPIFYPSGRWWVVTDGKNLPMLFAIDPTRS